MLNTEIDLRGLPTERQHSWTFGEAGADAARQWCSILTAPELVDYPACPSCGAYRLERSSGETIECGSCGAFFYPEDAENLIEDAIA